MKTRASKTVVIVGGGLTAGLIARQLTAKGVEVLVLERGGDHSKGPESSLPNQRDELRWAVRQGLIQDWSRETYTLRHQQNQTALPVRWMESFLPGQGLGGAGNHWNGHLWRWAEYDPQLRSHFLQRYGKQAIPADMPLQDWGVTYAQLEPYHDLFEKLFGVSGQAGNIGGKKLPGGNPFEAPRSGPYPQAPLQVLESGLVFKQACEQLGYHAFPQAAANSSGAYTNPDGQKLGQCQYCGHCERFICEANAKGSPQVLLYPMLRERKSFEVRLNTQVLGLRYDAAGKRATAVHCLDLLTGEEYEQPAEVIVLAAFTMSNTQLLLHSKIGKPYDPVSNTGVVGKNFCYQVNAGVDLFFKDKWFNPFLASGSTQIVIDDFNNDNFDHTGLGFLGGATIQAYQFSGRPIKGRRVPDGTPRWGTAWKQANADWYAHSMSLGIEGSCYPHRGNYLSLDPTYRDAYGRPLIRMTFDWRDNEQKMARFVSGKMMDIARHCGADKVGSLQGLVTPFDSRLYQTTHIVGGTIMGETPHDSVVSPHLQHWDAHNLFVVGASVYPHNSGYNPTGPLGALALRLGDDLQRYLQRPGRL